jgi:glycosyltransferase involved in cell wall biosynthesis
VTGDVGETAGVTTIITTKDEELHVARCIDSVRPLGRVVVVDGGSGDRTIEIARARGADVVEHAWQGYADQKNWALAETGIATPWVLFMDADEYLTPAGRDEIGAAIRDGSAAGYLLPRAQIFLGRRLDHAWWYPDYQLRLFRADRGRFEGRRVHEHVVVDGPESTLREPIMHENLKGLAAMIERHNRYSDLEVAELLDPAAVRRTGSFTGSWMDRRRALKDRVWFRVPGRPTVRFLWLYVVKRGFLDGRQGRIYCRMIAMYDAMIDAKLAERKLRGERRAGDDR